jgi:uncharacterized membrane protein YdjX (TVP38/TMEM64 family)
VTDTRPFTGVWQAALVGAVLIALWLGGRAMALDVPAALAAIRGMGAAAPLVFIAAYAIAIVALMPSSLLTLAGGALFGLVHGALYALSGATLGSTAAFLMGRHGARRLVGRYLASKPNITVIDNAVSAKGRRLVFLLRLSPVVPFNFLNYALGLTTISVSDFTLASVGMIPGALLYAYWGKVAGEAFLLAGQARVPKDASYYVLLLGGLVATVAATTVVTRAAQRALRDV